MTAVSIILPTHNRAHTLVRAISSVLNQTYQDFELIIFDDASQDQTQKLVKAMADSRIYYERSDHRVGASAARNRGISTSKFELIAFQDSDDEWEPDKLQLQVEVLSAHRSCGVVYSDMLRIGKDQQIKPFEAPSFNSSSIVNDSTNCYSAQGLGIQSALIRRDCLAQAGLFDESLPALEDLDLFIRLQKHTTFFRIAKPLVRYWEEDGVSSNRIALAQARRLLLQKHAAELVSHRRFIAKELFEIAGLEQTLETQDS